MNRRRRPLSLPRLATRLRRAAPLRTGRDRCRTGTTPSALAVLAFCTALSPAGAAAQGAGSAGAEILRLTAGTRAAAFAGAYTAVVGDPDGVFYNPAAVGWLAAAAGLGYEAYVEDISVGSFSGAFAAGRLRLGGGIVFLDAGDIDEVVPDPMYGGERGRPTGETVSASEAAVRVAAALPLLEGRASAGAAVGIVASDLAGVERSALFLDLGAQYRAGDLSVGAALRHLGTGLASDEFGDAPLPLEARLGAAYRRDISGRYGAVASADVVLGLEEETLGVALGGEAGLLPRDGALTAVLRAGVTAGEGEGHLGRLRVGGGIGLMGLALDYTVQTFEYLGSVHRIGVRWTR